MLVGFVAQSVPRHNFDGKIWLEQVSEPTLMTRLTANQRFSDDVNVNVTIEGGDWKVLFDNIVLILSIDIIITIGEYYCLEHYIIDRIEFS